MRQSLILFDKGASSARDTLLTKRNCLWSRAFGRDVTGDPTYFHAAVAAIIRFALLRKLPRRLA
jgi:hypothetical protein